MCLSSSLSSLVSDSVNDPHPLARSSLWRLLHVGGGGLYASVGHQGPVVPLAGPEDALLRLPVDLHLERLHVRLVFLIGRQADSWE